MPFAAAAWSVTAVLSNSLFTVKFGLAGVVADIVRDVYGYVARNGV